ncbi:hypothetical protein PSHT_04224 [Puccinia striiformis]|uniref:Uncharacterized protein n=1 Tax=Puccinia striiformis TaxID=27350 RepID=A0A2S4WDF7_9BASI|nr:hypothetical protein PSHT_04224 [Puccinia striiformis]
MPQTAWFCYFLVYLICLFSLVSPLLIGFQPETSASVSSRNFINQVNRKQQPSQPINEPSNNTVESKTDQLASNASDSNATSVPPTPVLQPADIPVLTANHATIASNPPPAYNPIPTIHQRIAEHNQIFDQQVEEIIDPNVNLELQVAFTLVDLRQMMYLVTTDFATYCNAFPAGCGERQARVRVLRAYQDHLNLFVQLA